MYLLGKLPAEEHAAMDAKIAADNHLQEEVTMQRDIMRALQEERRLELKSRLNNIEVGGAAGGFSTALGLKLAAGVALMGIMSTGLYLYFNDTASAEQTNLPVGIIELPENNQLLTYTIPVRPAVAEGAETITTEAAPKNKQAVNNIAAAPPKVATPTVDRPAATREASSAELPAAKKEDRKETAQPNIQVQKPKVFSDFKDTDIAANNQQMEAPVDAMARNRQFSTHTIEVTAQLHDKWDFHYQFYDSKLFIYGDFKSKPYEILEINTEGTTSYYLYFENNYYGLKSDQQKLSRLRKLTNEKLIKELNITRTQKATPQHY